MSVIDTVEEIISEVDLQAEFTKNGLSFSVYMDDLEFHEAVDYDDMAYMMCQDADKYPDPELARIADGFRMMSTILEEELDARG